MKKNRFDSNGWRQGYWEVFAHNRYYHGSFNHGDPYGYWKIYDYDGSMIEQRFYL